MGNLGSECVISSLEQGLSHHNLDVVAAARRSLGEINHVDSEAALLRHFHNSSTFDTRARVQTLRSLAKQNCSHQTAFSILSIGLKVVGTPSSVSNKTCHKICTLRCSIRGPVKCLNFCSHRCANLLLFKAEVGKFLYSVRNSVSFLDLVNDALSAGLFSGLANLGIFPETKTKPLALSIGHSPFHWTKRFGNGFLGANLTLHFENSMRVWLSTFDRGMETIIDDSVSAAAHAWIFSFKIMEAGISFQSSYTSPKPAPLDLKTTLSEWEVKPSHEVRASSFVESLWKVSSAMESIHRDESYLTMIHRSQRGPQTITAFCQMQENVLRYFSEDLKVQSLEPSAQISERLQALDYFAMSSGKVIETMQSAQRHLTEGNSALLNSSNLLKSALLDFQADVERNVEHVKELTSFESVKALVNISDRLLFKFDSDTLILSAELSSLQTFQRRAALLIQSRNWGVLESVFEAAVEKLAMLPEKLAFFPLLHGTMEQVVLRPHSGQRFRLVEMRKRLAGVLQMEGAMLASANALKSQFLDFVAAKNIQNSVTLDAFKKVALEVKLHVAQLDDSWSKLNVDELDIIQNMLLEREEGLILLKKSLSPSGVFSHSCSLSHYDVCFHFCCHSFESIVRLFAHSPSHLSYQWT